MNQCHERWHVGKHSIQTNKLNTFKTIKSVTEIVILINTRFTKVQKRLSTFWVEASVFNKGEKISQASTTTSAFGIILSWMQKCIGFPPPRTFGFCFHLLWGMVLHGHVHHVNIFTWTKSKPVMINWRTMGRRWPPKLSNTGPRTNVVGDHWSKPKDWQLLTEKLEILIHEVSLEDSKMMAWFFFCQDSEFLLVGDVLVTASPTSVVTVIL